MRSDSRYQLAYKELGNERAQSDVPENLSENVLRKGTVSKHSPFEVYWTLRRLKL